MQAAQHGVGREVPKEPMRRRINDFLARTVSRFRVVLWAVIIAAAVFLLGYFIYGQVQNARSTQAVQLAETAQDTYTSWQAETDATKKAPIEKQLLDQLGAVIKRYPNQYGAQRALFIRADVNYTNKAWDAAIKDYETLATRFPKSYLTPISMYDEATSYEEKGDADGAQKLYVKVYTSFKDSIVAPRAVFDAARIDESKNAWTDAQTKYQSLDTLYPQSAWDKLAKNRIVELKMMGKIK